MYNVLIDLFINKLTDLVRVILDLPAIETYLLHIGHTW